ncbi:hypothetical protein [Microbacterium sp. KR10-403]|uniref:hypothetical protein n=1 Tax=Microbacterium sp. KR10-403 TaxID=3158581 RepID=UPI0032E4ECB8
MGLRAWLARRQRDDAEHRSAASTPEQRARTQIDWPVDDETGEVFDLEWLDAGTRKELTAGEELIIARASGMTDPEKLLFGKFVPSYVRTEYNRRVLIEQFGHRFAHQPVSVQTAGNVRGAFYLEWGPHIDHLKRTGHLESALALAYEVMDAAERTENGDAFGWYERVAIILRKMRDYEAEVRFLEGVVKRWPKYTELSTRLVRAKALLAKERARG